MLLDVVGLAEALLPQPLAGNSKSSGKETPVNYWAGFIGRGSPKDRAGFSREIGRGLRLNATNINRQKGRGIRGYKVFQPCNPETIKQGIEKVTFRSLASVYAGVAFKRYTVL
jgi:hypothetical protein